MSETEERRELEFDTILELSASSTEADFLVRAFGDSSSELESSNDSLASLSNESLIFACTKKLVSFASVIGSSRSSSSASSYLYVLI